MYLMVLLLFEMNLNNSFLEAIIRNTIFDKNNFMKKILVLAVAALGFSMNVSAQNKKATTTHKDVVAQNTNPELAIENNAKAATQKIDKLVGGLSKEQQDRIMEGNMNFERRKQIVLQMNDVNKSKMLQEIEDNRTRMYLEVLKDKQVEKYQNTLKK